MIVVKPRPSSNSSHPLQTRSQKNNPRHIQGGTSIEGLASDLDIRDTWAKRSFSVSFIQALACEFRCFFCGVGLTHQ